MSGDLSASPIAEAAVHRFVNEVIEQIRRELPAGG
jgi:hypothetical protein